MWSDVLRSPRTITHEGACSISHATPCNTVSACPCFRSTRWYRSTGEVFPQADKLWKGYEACDHRQDAVRGEREREHSVHRMSANTGFVQAGSGCYSACVCSIVGGQQGCEGQGSCRPSLSWSKCWITRLHVLRNCGSRSLTKRIRVRQDSISTRSNFPSPSLSKWSKASCSGSSTASTCVAVAVNQSLASSSI